MVGEGGESSVPRGPGKGSQVGDDLLDRAFDALTVANTASNDGSTPALPPAMAAMHGKSSDEILAELNKTPLFMTSLEENDELEAFKALAYEGSPFEVALNFKEQGNESFKERKWADAKEFYSKGIQVLQSEHQKRLAEVRTTQGQDHEPSKEEHEELGILETCLVNRAACHLSLHNYRSCTLDCASALRLNPKNIKAYYRSSKALLALSKIPEADDVCARGLALDPQNAALKQVAEQIVAKNADLEAKSKRELAAQQKKRQEELLLTAALKARGIRTRKTAQPPDMEDARVRLVPDPLDAQSELVFPTVLLYPLSLQSDFIKDFGETDTIASRLQEVLAERPAWDADGEYGYKRVECYMETLKGGLVKVGKNVSLLKVLSGGAVEVVDEVVRLFVVPKARAEAWIQDFKMKKAAERGSA